MTTAEVDVTGTAEQYRLSVEAAQPALDGVPKPVAVNKCSPATRTCSGGR